jgi:hypothetical protein
MAYQYDVFISYKRGGPKAEWISDIFLPLFRNDLSQNLGRQAEVFLDTETIEGGTPWPNVLAEALGATRCLTAILSPLYFTSPWCTIEFSIMANRQNNLRQERLLQTNQSLLAPFLQQGPTTYFPPYVSQIQLLDYSKYNRVGKGFKDSSDYDELQQKITADAAKVARSVMAAPPWEDRFSSQGWISGPFNLDNKIVLDVQPKQAKPSW